MSEEINDRAHAIIHGRVQGVCFRIETQRAAQRIGLAGWVRNLADGTVEAVFEGTPGQVDRMLEWCHQGPPASQVTKVDIRRQTHPKSFASFEITY
jgi:acylphosphatase